MKIELKIKHYHGQTDADTHTEWLLALLVGGKNNNLLNI